jgi:NADPH2:quinone reductase
MKAVTINKFGPADEVIAIIDVEKPVAGAGEVLVKVHTSSPNPSDTNKRNGSFPNLLDNGHVIPHSDGAGVIEAVGEGVDASLVGQRVWMFNAQYGRLLGTCAEYVALGEEYVVPLPDNVSFAQGACLGIPVMTAHRCVYADGDVSGKTIVISGGAGRVGNYAIQFAKSSGAKVIATIVSEESRAACLEAGADAVINGRDEDAAEQILAANGGDRVDRIIEVQFGANLPLNLKIIALNGVISTYNSTIEREPVLPFFQMMYQCPTVHFVIVYAMPLEARLHAIKDITESLEKNKLDLRIGQEFAMEDCAAAHKVIEEGKVRGTVVVNIQ